ncbi:MAG TPA: hypothetical protein VMF35_17535 [Acidimicrobiales bacterium]|nr:hypothetical protein [Acidimicrobiales bacterium]
MRRSPAVPERRLRAGAVAGALLLAVPALAACGSGSGAASGSGSGSSSESADARLAQAGTTVQQQMTQYEAAAQKCKSESSPIVCLEKADRTLGGQVHDYANVLAVGHGFTAPESSLSAARNAAQLLANSLEILGDAEPTQANYDQVLNTYNVNSAIAQLQSAVTKLSSH